MTETELEFHWNGEVIERTEKHRGAKGAFVNWRHVVLALQRKPGALIGWRHREAMFPGARWRGLYDGLNKRHSPGRAEREYLGILALGLQERLGAWKQRSKNWRPKSASTRCGGVFAHPTTSWR